MSEHSNWPGHVKNRSSSPVWVIWDEGDDKNKKWYAKPLAPNYKSPDKLDIDGVRAHAPGMRITDLDWRGHVKTPTSDWWWLKNGAEVVIKDGYAMQTIEQLSTIGSLVIVTQEQVKDWNVTELPYEPNWGEKL